MTHVSGRVVYSVRSGLRAIVLFLAVAAVIACGALPAMAASGSFVLHNTPSYVATAQNLGLEDPSKIIEVSLWLNPHNRAALDAIARQLYDPASPNFRRFLTRPQIAAEFAPTAPEAQTVRRFLEAHNLKVTEMGPSNFFVRASGTVGNIEAAFNVQLSRYQVQNKIIRANNRDPFIEGAAGPLVKAIYGLDSTTFEHPTLARPTDLQAMANRTSSGATTLPKASTDVSSVAKSKLSSSFFTNNCFIGTETDVFSTNDDGSLPIGTYKGNHLNLPSLTSVGCGYTPPMIQAAYHLDTLYKAGLTGKGQTIGIIDQCSSPTIQNDANAFSAKFGLPLLTKSNFKIIFIPAIAVTCGFAQNVEVNLDVEWAHAIAPGANINLLIAPNNSMLDLDEAEFVAVMNGLATVLSGSYGFPEPFIAQSEIENENMISEMAAVVGISTNFSSGDSGDFSSSQLPQLVQAPADSPFATAVGGISLALNSNNSIQWQAGWGNNLTVLANSGTVFDPPLAVGLVAGSGGGSSSCVNQNFDPTTGIVTCLGGFAKPAYQNNLPGTTRQLPDVSWLADPFTGGVIAYSIPNISPQVVYQVFGGTSLACPMFSGLWAIANQAAGKPLGQAAPYLYALPSGAITDIVPFGTLHNNVTANIQESSTMTTNFTAAEMLGGAVGPDNFIDGIWDNPSLPDSGLLISFGQDCSSNPNQNPLIVTCADPNRLHTNVGWDNVTGVGVPNPIEFVQAFAAPKKK